MKRDLGLPMGDEHRYLMAADRARALLGNPPGNLLSLVKELGDVHPTHPPLFPVLAGAFMMGVGMKLEQGMVLQLVFLLLLVVATYKAGRILSDRRRGLAAAIMVAAFPLTFRYTHVFMLELPTAALVALGMWLLIAWRAYGGWRRALGFGVVVGLGMLTKWTFAVFLFIPVLMLLDRLRRHRDFGAREVWAGLLLGVLLPLFWYVQHAGRLFQFFSWNQANPYWHLADAASVEGWFFYLKSLPLMMGGVPFVFFLFGMGVACMRLRRERILLGWLILPLVVFTLMRTKAFDGRHLLPALPAAALLAATVVLIPWRPARLAAWIGVLAAVPLNLIPGAGLGLKHTLRSMVPGTDYSIVGTYCEPPQNDFSAGEIYCRIRESMENCGQDRARVLVLAAFRSLNAGGVTYLGRLEDVKVYAFSPEPGAAGEVLKGKAMWRQILEADYVVVKEGLPVDSNLNGFRRNLLLWSDFFQDPGRRMPGTLASVAEVVTPDGDRVRIFHRIMEADRAVTEEVLRWSLRTLMENRSSPDFKEAMGALAKLVRDRGATRQGKALDALQDLDADRLRALAADVPEEPWVVYSAASALHEAGKPEEAIALLDAGPTESFLSFAMHRLRGRIYLQQGKAAQAAQAWKKEADLDHRSAEVYRRLAGVYEGMEGVNPDLAIRTLRIAECKAAVELSPVDRWRAAAELGKRLEVKNPEEAVKYLFTVVLSAPMKEAVAFEAFHLWMKLMQQAGRREEAVAFLKRRQRVEADEELEEMIKGFLEKLEGT